MTFFPLIFFYVLDLLGKMPTKVWFIIKVHKKIEIDKRKKKRKGVRQTTKYK
jgi:hypothetical protein